MNMNIVAFYEDFINESESHKHEGFEFLINKFNFSRDEMHELISVASEEVNNFFNTSKAVKKKDQEAVKNLITIFVTAFFFGMYTGREADWPWPKE